MFIAMNRFRVLRGSEADFERVWLERDSHLDQVPGFLEFHFLKGREDDEHTLYVSHSAWRSREDFENWTRSDAFRKAHRTAGGNKTLYAEPPTLELFEAVQDTRKGES